MASSNYLTSSTRHPEHCGDLSTMAFIARHLHHSRALIFLTRIKAFLHSGILTIPLSSDHAILRRASLARWHTYHPAGLGILVTSELWYLQHSGIFKLQYDTLAFWCPQNYSVIPSAFWYFGITVCFLQHPYLLRIKELYFQHSGILKIQHGIISILTSSHPQQGIFGTLAL